MPSTRAAARPATSQGRGSGLWAQALTTTRRVASKSWRIHATRNAMSQPPPIRDPRYAPPRYAIDHRADGAIDLANAAPFSTAFSTTNAPLDHWAAVTPERLWLAERSGEGWRRVSFSEGLEAVAALAGALAGLGLGPGKPLLILARNGIAQALVT